jgi:hypothetical protein
MERYPGMHIGMHLVSFGKSGVTANKDKYHPSDGVLDPRVQLPRAKASVRTVPTWGERKTEGGVAGGVKSVRPVSKPVIPVWSLQSGKFGFRAREESQFVSCGRGSGGWYGESVGGQFAGRFSLSCSIRGWEES